MNSILESALSPYEEYCDGYGNYGASGNGYVLGLVLGVGKDKVKFSHPGSSILDKINAFDLAEVDSAYIGQLNMSIVSSFCGPQGLIWGYDVARVDIKSINLAEGKKIFNLNNELVNVFSAEPLIEATKSLFGTRDDLRFPLRPGSHVPFAGKNFTYEGPKTIYSGIALGVPENRKTNAVLLMEDIGWIPPMGSKKRMANYKEMILTSLAESVMQVGRNQNVNYVDVLVAMKELEITYGEIGCALVAAPYFTLAKNAYVSNLESLTLDEWKKITIK